VKLIARHDGAEIPIEVERHGSGYRVSLGGRWINVDLAAAGPFAHSLRLDDGTQFAISHHREGNRHEVSIGGSAVLVEIVDPLALKRSSREDSAGGGGMVKALMPGRIVRVLVEEGERVTRGKGLLILEAMKMENEIQAPADGTIDQLFVKAGDTVESGSPLAHLAAG
jgi:biotin carboxyl carrier protein